MPLRAQRFGKCQPPEGFIFSEAPRWRLPQVQ